MQEVLFYPHPLCVYEILNYHFPLLTNWHIALLPCRFRFIECVMDPRHVSGCHQPVRIRNNANNSAHSQLQSTNSPCTVTYHRCWSNGNDARDDSPSIGWVSWVGVWNRVESCELLNRNCKRKYCGNLFKHVE